ncbi:MAG TPA: type 1 glutamine amidotransferase [Chitinophagaceae bacterium]|jgi:GMP synthase (glutamine-hydrolysing)|nr:type 1 glutamine amidotransferase [Chitinophagaceae bacterium]
MRIHFIQHVSFEYPGSILAWAEQHGFTCSFTRTDTDPVFPSLTAFDMLVIMGGPMGTYEEEKYQWLKKEKSFIRSAIDASKKVLGICLGCQLIAEVLGANVYPHAEKEIGWWPVQKVEEHPLTKNLPDGFDTFHLHGDTFDLPHGAVHLFRSAACPQQGFAFANTILALQFHPEMESKLLNNMITHEKEQLVTAAFVQTAETIMQRSEEKLSLQKQLMYQLLDNFINLA